MAWERFGWWLLFGLALYILYGYGHSTLRRNAPPEPIEASWLVPDNPPIQFTWRRRLHRVARADGSERIAEEWWTEEGSAAADAIRDYYRVEDEEGRRFWLFRAGLAQSEPSPRWFVHGLFA